MYVAVKLYYVVLDSFKCIMYVQVIQSGTAEGRKLLERRYVCRDWSLMVAFMGSERDLEIMYFNVLASNDCSAEN